MNCQANNYSNNKGYKPSVLRIVGRWIRCHIFDSHFFYKEVVDIDHFGEDIEERVCFHCKIRGFKLFAD